MRSPHKGMRSQFLKAILQARPSPTEAHHPSSWVMAAAELPIWKKASVRPPPFKEQQIMAFLIRLGSTWGLMIDNWGESSRVRIPRVLLHTTFRGNDKLDPAMAKLCIANSTERLGAELIASKAFHLVLVSIYSARCCLLSSQSCIHAYERT